jgi:DNA-binding Lrp family transcriptional regulator
MSIQLIITGEHTTDLLAEIKTLADALSITPPPKMERARELVQEGVEQAESVARAVIETAAENGFASHSIPCDDEEEIVKKVTTIKGKQHVIEADRMIEEGKRNHMYAFLSTRQKNRVDAALAVKKNVESLPDDTFVSGEPKEPELAFGDDMILPEKITLDEIKALIKERTKDDNGQDIPDMLQSAFKLVASYIPKGDEVKISNVPYARYNELYIGIKAL